MNKELKAIDGTICNTMEELEKANNEFWANIFNIPYNNQTIYAQYFKAYYESFIQNSPNLFEKWLSIYLDFKYLLKQNLLNPNFSRIFAGVLILYKPEITILNEYFRYNDIKRDLLEIYQFFQSSHISRVVKNLI